MSTLSNVGSVTFEGESAGYQNTVGMYKIAADGTIYDVEILFANASLAGSGGSLKAGSSSIDVKVEGGEKVGFFVVPNGYDKSGMPGLLNSNAGSFKFVTASGAEGNVNGGEPLKLVYVSPNGKETDVKGEYGTSVFHSVDDGSKGLNGDGLNHVKITTNADGSMKIGFEDLKGGGDKDFDDAVFTFRTSEAAKAYVAPAVELGSELLIDGSFEQALIGANTWGHQAQVGGWKSSSEVEVWGKGFNGVKATDGDKVAELDYDTRASNIYQDVKTEAGAEYTFNFDYMKRPDSKSGSDTIEVYWNGKLIGKVDPTKSEWAKAEFKVTGTGATDRIEFREEAGDNDSYGGLIDNASLKKSGESAAEKAAREAAEKAEKEAKEKAEKEAAEKAAAEKAAREAAEKAEKEAAEKAAAEKAAREAAEKAEKEAKEKAEKEAAEKAAAEKAAREAAEKAEKEAKEKAEKEAAEKAAAEKAAREAAEKAEKEAKEKAEKEAAEKAAAEKAAREAAEKAEKEAKEKAEKEAAEKAAREAAEKAEKEAKEKAEKEAAEKAAAEKAAREAAEKAAAEKAAKEAAEKEAAEKAAKEAAEKEAAEKAAKEAAEKEAAEKAAKEAAEKEAAEKAAKEAAEKEAAEKAAKEAAEKEAAEKAAKEAAEKEAAEKAAKEAAEKAAAEKAAQEAAEKAAAEKAAQEAAEKAAAEKAAQEAAEKAAAEKAAQEAAEKAGVDIHIGDNSVDKLSGWDNHDSIVFGEGGKDVLQGLGGNDTMHGGGGDDSMSGDDGEDLMFGGSTLGGKVDMTKFRITEDTTAKVTFNYESAGYQNTLGVYKIAADGTISGVQILFANASLKGDGGDLVSGVSSVDVAMKAGERIGFFVVPDGFAQKGMAALLNDKTASFKFVDGNGKPGNVNAGSELKLVQVAKNGTETVVKSAYGSTVFHSVDDGSKGLNGDGMKHVVGNVNNLDGTVKIGFEDLKGGGDKDFDDSVFTVNLGVVNSSLLAKEATKPVTSSDKDDMKGGTGNDVMFGMSDNDKMDGGAGDDQMWGNAGADRMRGGEGNDDVRGGKDDDVLWGEAGDDKLAGNTGNDTLHGGDGRDTLSGDSGNDLISGGRGDDREIGGSGDDVFLGGAGNDTIEGGSGFDTLDYRHLNTGMAIDLSKHTATGKGAGADTVSGIEAVFGSAKNDTIYGDKNANVIDGSAGNDVIRGAAGSDTLTGGEGSDTFIWSLKDVGAGKGVDHITDFSKDDKLNLHELLKGQKFSSISDVVKVTDTAEGSKVSVKVGGAMVDVTVLDGVHNASAVELLKAGMILA